jgi:hypothetical protein
MCPAADPLACTCEYRQLKLYVGANGVRVLRDLLLDPDEAGLGDQLVGPVSATGPVVDRLRCCLDAWWSPDGSRGCADKCDPAFACAP